MTLRELDASETHLAYTAMRELRTHLESLDAFVTKINAHQRPDGYRLVASFESDAVAAVAGFRRVSSLAWGQAVYIDDLVTLEASRGRGHASRLLEWVAEEAGRLGCGQLHLDSGSQRHDAHRLYMRAGYRIGGFHFARGIETLDRALA